MRECLPPTTWHMAGVTCHMSRATCHVSGVTRHVPFFLLLFGQSCGACRRRVCYRRGLPRLVAKLQIFQLPPVKPLIQKIWKAVYLAIFVNIDIRGIYIKIYLAGQKDHK